MDHIKDSNGEIKAYVWTPLENIEKTAMQQIYDMIKHPRLFKHLAIMPDVHAGKGTTIGSVIPLINAIIPSAVGVDIGCGCCAAQTNIPLEAIRPYFNDIHKQILMRIPLGFSHRGDQQLNDVMQNVSQDLINQIRGYALDERWMTQSSPYSIIKQLGTLGGGNHFIELQADDLDQIWIMIHSGSRNIGNKIATTYIKLAEVNCSDAPAKDLEYFEANSELGKEYIVHAGFATTFAYNNRRIMMEVIKDILNNLVGPNCYSEMVNIHHNYVDYENHFGEMVWVHRKGATRVTSSVVGIIPGSMGTASYIVQGTDNADSFKSCSHGAGRAMSRTAARGKFDRKHKSFKTDGQLSVKDFEKDMKDVFTKDVNRDHLDEAPKAYKEIDQVMHNQSDLVVIKTKLMPVFNVKG
jgi:tRNA-splicing ligase RtcB